MKVIGWLAAAGLVVGGVWLVVGNRHPGGIATVEQRGPELPQGEVVVGSKRIAVQVASRGPNEQIAWLGRANRHSVATVIDWGSPVVEPVLDVPDGWVVAFVRDGKVVEILSSPGTLPNALLPRQPANAALLLPASARPMGGQAVQVSVSQSRKI